MRVWSKGLGRVELAADLKNVRVVFDGESILLTGKTVPPVSWEFVVVLNSSELWPMMRLVMSKAGIRFVTKWLKLLLLDHKGMQENYKIATKTRPGAKPEIEYAGIIRGNQKDANKLLAKTRTQPVVVAPTNTVELNSETKISLDDISRKYYDLATNGSLKQNPGWFSEWFKYAMREPFEAVDFIMKEIVLKDRCTGCVACVEVCPVDVFDYVGDRPVDRRHSNCIFCGMCAAVCPSARLGSSNLSNTVVAGNVRDDGFGRYRKAVIARTKDPEIMQRAQDGGIVTTLLAYALDEKMVDAVILGDIAKGQPLIPIPRLATTKEQLFSSAGSRYTYSANTAKLREAYDRDLRVAVVGVPCQINGLRHSQIGETADFDFTNWFRNKIVFTVGLFCSEVFTRKGLDDLSTRTKIPLSEIAGLNVKGKVVVKTKDGDRVISSLKQMNKFKRPSCINCWDYSAELADIACGGIGLKGWTLTIARTELGQSLCDSLIEKGLIETKTLEEAPSSREMLVNLSNEKRSRPKLGADTI